MLNKFYKQNSLFKPCDKSLYEYGSPVLKSTYKTKNNYDIKITFNFPDNYPYELKLIFQ